MDLLLDDHLLLRALHPRRRARAPWGRGRLWTTGLWHHRLCRATTDTTVDGVFTRKLRAVDPSAGRAVRAALIDLPADIGLLSFRHLAWPMALLLEQGPSLNLLALEALAAAEELGATICLAPEDENPPLVAAAEARGVDVRIVPAE